MVRKNTAGKAKTPAKKRGKPAPIDPVILESKKGYVCMNCWNVSRGRTEYCEKCGGSLRLDSLVVCPECVSLNMQDADNCAYCGKGLKPGVRRKAVTQPPPKIEFDDIQQYSFTHSSLFNRISTVLLYLLGTCLVLSSGCFLTFGVGFGISSRDPFTDGAGAMALTLTVIGLIIGTIAFFLIRHLVKQRNRIKQQNDPQDGLK